MFDFVKKLFSSGKTVEKTADNLFDKKNGLVAQAGSWIGNLNYTDEEKAELNFKIGEKVTEFVGTTLSENSERSITRREVAILWIKTQLALILMVAITAPFDKELSRMYYELSVSEVMLWGTGSIIVFFFGGYVWGTHIKGNQKT